MIGPERPDLKRQGSSEKQDGKDQSNGKHSGESAQKRKDLSSSALTRPPIL